MLKKALKTDYSFEYTPHTETGRLLHKAKQGDKEAAYLFCCAHLPFALKYINRNFWGANKSFVEDIISRVFEKMLIALDKYDPDKSYKYLTYCKGYIKSGVCQAIKEHNNKFYKRIEDTSVTTKEIDRRYKAYNTIKTCRSDTMDELRPDFELEEQQLSTILNDAIYRLPAPYNDIVYRHMMGQSGISIAREYDYCGESIRLKIRQAYDMLHDDLISRGYTLEDVV